MRKQASFPLGKVARARLAGAISPGPGPLPIYKTVSVAARLAGERGSLRVVRPKPREVIILTQIRCLGRELTLVSLR